MNDSGQHDSPGYNLSPNVIKIGSTSVVLTWITTRTEKLSPLQYYIHIRDLKAREKKKFTLHEKF